MVTLIHWAAFALGVLLWSLPFVLYQDEEARLRNKLVDWWVVVTTSGEMVVRKHVFLTQALAAQTLKAISLCFGKKPFSLQAIWATVMVSSAAFDLWTAFGDYGIGRFFGGPYLPGSPRMALRAVPALALGLLPGIIRVQKRLGARYAAWALPVAYCAYQAYSWFRHGYIAQLRVHAEPYRIVLAAYVVAVAYGLLMVELLRRVLGKAIGSTGRSVPIMGMLVSMPALIWGGPHLAIKAVTNGAGLTLGGLEYADTRGWMGVVGAAMFSIPLNSIWIVVSFGLIAAVVLLAINALLWSLTARILNALYSRLPGRATLVVTGAFFWAAFFTSFSESFKHLVGAK